MSSAPEPANQHFSVDPEGKSVVDLTFASEAIGMPASEGYGWAQLDFGDCLGDESIGQGDRYRVMRKLGWGMHSSTWLARDKLESRFVAIKALTGHMTRMYEKAVVWEADAFRLLSALPRSPHCLELLDEFTVPGRGSSGSHMCFVMPVYGGDVRALAKSRTTPFPLALAKRIVLHTLRGLAHAHSRSVVHADLKSDNIFFDTKLSTEEIERWIERDPSRRNPPEASHDGVLQSAVSQPLPMISEEVALRSTFVLADYGCAQCSKLHDDRTVIIPPLRPPESFLGGNWDKPADIWALGCLAFEIITSRTLLKYQTNEKFGLTEVESMLYQMMMVTGGELFRAAQLLTWPLAGEYFNANCRLKKEINLFHWPLENLVEKTQSVPREDVPAVAQFVRRCLRLNPDERATAEELLKDPLFDGVD